MRLLRCALVTTAALAVVACGGTREGRPAPWVVDRSKPRSTPDLRPLTLPAGATWRKLTTKPYPGKQDDIFFVDPRRGWYVNGAGQIYRTEDGGSAWTEQLAKPGTYFRTIGFVDESLGFAGNLGTDYFPGVTDTTPLYRTRDGGATWAAVALPPDVTVKGLCSIDVLHTRFIDAGHLEDRVLVHAAGRVGGPAVLLRSLDGGETFSAIDLDASAAMILDVKFFDEMHGLVFAGTDANVERSHALILATADGGATWTTAYRSTRPFELVWKASFPTREVGYATIMSYDQDATRSQRYVAKTVDGGKTWTELPLVADVAALEFGIGFASPDLGWVGTGSTGYQTTDGGASWTKVELGQAANKIRILRDGAGFVAYAIGVDVYKLDATAAATGHG